MTINAIFSAGLQGVNAAVRGTAVAAQEIATMNVPRSERGDGVKRVRSVSDLASAMVDLNVYEHQAKASVKVINTADEMLGTLIDEYV